MGAAQSNAYRQRPAQSNALDLTPLDEFSTLAERHERIHKLFNSISRELDTAEHVGRGHPLCRAWNILHKRHTQIFQDSVQNAIVSAECLKALENNIVSWQRFSTPNLVNMEDMVDFKQQLEGHAFKAHGITVRFEELGESIKQFKSHIPGFWTGLRASSANDALDRLLDILLGVIEWVTSRVFGMHGTGYCGASGYMDISTNPKGTRRTVVIDREKLDSMEGLLSKTVKTWKALNMRYAHLLDALAAARSVVNDSEVCDVYLKAARLSCMVLYECMSTYNAERTS